MIDFFHEKKSIVLWFNWKIMKYDNMKWNAIGLARSETSTRCRSSNGLLGLANIWSRLLKHNWWDLLYGRVRIHSDVFFDFTFNENSLLYGYINRASPEFQPMHVYDQQLCFLFHRCGSLFLFLNSWRWIVPKSSDEIDHHRPSSGFRENQNTVERNEFYEWGI